MPRDNHAPAGRITCAGLGKIGVARNRVRRRVSLDVSSPCRCGAGVVGQPARPKAWRERRARATTPFAPPWPRPASRKSRCAISSHPVGRKALVLDGCDAGRRWCRPPRASACPPRARARSGARWTGANRAGAGAAGRLERRWPDGERYAAHALARARGGRSAYGCARARDVQAPAPPTALPPPPAVQEEESSEYDEEQYDGAYPDEYTDGWQVRMCMHAQRADVLPDSAFHGRRRRARACRRATPVCTTARVRGGMHGLRQAERA